MVLSPATFRFGIAHSFGQSVNQFQKQSNRSAEPTCSMYGIFSYMFHKFMVNVGKLFQSHGASGRVQSFIRIIVKTKQTGHPFTNPNQSWHLWRIFFGKWHWVFQVLTMSEDMSRTFSWQILPCFFFNPEISTDPRDP